MEVTIFAVIIAALGVLLMLRGGAMDMLLLVMACTLLGGSAALILSGIGGSSVPPAHFALMFAVLRIFLPGSGRLQLGQQALRANLFLALFVAYALATAIFAPIYFRDALQVPPMRSTGPSASMFATVSLAPSPQNLTAAVYIVGSLLLAIVAHVAMQEKSAGQRFVKMGVIIAWVHITLGVLAAVLRGTPFDLFVDFMRNASYEQHNQTLEGFVRITGIFPEPSSYVGFAFGWFVFLFECWLRDVLPRRTGPAGFAMGLILIASTSSTAYVALACYGAILGLRYLFAPQFLNPRKGTVIAAAGVVAVFAGIAASLAVPALVDSMTSILLSMTVDKQQSSSALQRAFWAKTGIDAFWVSYGIGIGPGSFRSSSFFAALVGSVGVIGSVAFLAHLLRAFKPLHISTYCGPRGGAVLGQDAMIGAAASWAAIGVMLPAAFVSPTCDPGGDFAVFTAVALALRMRPAPSPGAATLASDPLRRFPGRATGMAARSPEAV